MTAPAETRVVFDDFSGGDWGTLGPFAARPGMVSASNMMLFNDRSIGPRPGLKRHSMSGIAGTLRSLYYSGYPGSPARVLLAVAGSGGGAGKTIYYSDDDGGSTITWTALGTTLSAAATEWCPVDFYDPNGYVYLSNPADKTYKIDWPTGAVTSFQVAGSDRGLRTLRLYRDRLYVTDDQTSPAASNPAHRVYYSDAGAFDTIGATNFFDIGYFWEVGAAEPVNNALYFMQRQQGWWALVGGSPLTGSLRRVRNDGTYIDAAAKQRAVINENGKLWFWTHGDRLASTNGATFDVDSYSHLILSGTKQGQYFDGYRHSLFMSATGNLGLLNAEGAWFRQAFGVTLTGEVCNTEFKDRALLANGTSYLYSLDFALDRPGFASDTNAQPGDNSTTPNTCTLDLPAIPGSKGREVRVRQVIVDVVKWNTGAAVDNALALEARTYLRYNPVTSNRDDYATETQTWTEPGSYGSTTGQRDRIIFNLGAEGHGGAVQVVFTAVKGLTIRSVEVVVEQADRPLR